MELSIEVLSRIFNLPIKRAYEVMNLNGQELTTQIDLFWLFNENCSTPVDKITLKEYFQHHELYEKTPQYRELKELFGANPGIKFDHELKKILAR